MTPERQPAILSRMVLGTAQLGMNYGVANCSGRPGAAQVQALIAQCLAHGVTSFDTAQAYGESEAILGQAFADLGVRDQVNVISKGSLHGAPTATLASRIHGSLQRLGLPRLDFWLLHDELQLAAWTAAVAREAADLGDAKLVGGFGLSAYTPDVALRAIEDCGLAALQFPASPMDRRFLRDGVLGRLAAGGTRLFIRSVFLQGLCLMTPAAVPPGIAHGRTAVEALAGFCATHALPRSGFCMHYVLNRTARTGAKIVIGLESMAQLESNLRVLREAPPDPALFDAWDAAWPDDLPELILPTRWALPK